MQNEVKNETKEKVVYELLETKQGHFCNGYSFTKEKKLKYYYKTFDSNNKLNKEKTKVFIRVCLPGDSDKEVNSFWHDYAVSLKLLEDFEIKFGIHLGDGSKKPIQLRFYQQGDLRFISNIALWTDRTCGIACGVNGATAIVGKAWEWLYEPAAKTTTNDDPLK